MAHRSLQLRDTLVHTKSEVRQHRQIVRKQSHQIDKITHDKAQALQQQALDMSQVEGQASQLAQDKVRSNECPSIHPHDHLFQSCRGEFHAMLTVPEMSRPFCRQLCETEWPA